MERNTIYTEMNLPYKIITKNSKQLQYLPLQRFILTT